MNEQLINDLKASKAELQRRGMCRGNLVRDRDGAVCTLGAIGCALVDNFAYRKGYEHFQQGRPAQVVHALARHLQPLYGYDEVDLIFHKNDKMSTTAQDMYDLFDKALAEEGGLA